MRSVVIFGATSAIAHALARELCTINTEFILVGRNQYKLHANANDLRALGALKVSTHCADFTDNTNVNISLNEILDHQPHVDLVLLAHSILPQRNDDIQNTIQINTISTMVCMCRMAEYMAKSNTGTMVLISSVAGDRGRQSNYLYGASKAAVNIFATGMRQAYAKQGLHILTVKPGFITTPMTQHMKQSILASTPEKISPKIIKAIYSKKNNIYVPGYWRYIMFIIRSIPEFLFKRLAL